MWHQQKQEVSFYLSHLMFNHVENSQSFIIKVRNVLKQLHPSTLFSSDGQLKFGWTQLGSLDGAARFHHLFQSCGRRRKLKTVMAEQRSNNIFFKKVLIHELPFNWSQQTRPQEDDLFTVLIHPLDLKYEKTEESAFNTAPL